MYRKKHCYNFPIEMQCFGHILPIVERKNVTNRQNKMNVVEWWWANVRSIPKGVDQT